MDDSQKSLELTAPSDAPEAASVQTDEEIIETALSRFALCEEAERDMREKAHDDLEFLAGNQWPLDVKQRRDLDGSPCLTVNRLPQQVQQVTNDLRQNRPSVKVAPVGGGATDDLADIIEGLVRHIQYNSDAETAYDTAAESAARGGFGYWRLLTDYSSPDTFNQEIFIKRIRNPFSVFFDPYAQEPDGSDANFAFITEDLSPDEYRARYPGTKLASASDWEAMGNAAPAWVRGDSCRVAEYFYKEYQSERLYLLKTGETVREADLAQRQMAAAQAGLDASIVRVRSAQVPVVKWVTLTGVEILEKTVWVGSFIPVIPVYGNELFLNGKRIVESVIRHAKDAQRMLNYWKSAATETIALAPRAPWVLAEGQVEEYEAIWETANRKNHAYLPYKPTTIAGSPVPPPQRQTFEPAVQAITQAAEGASQDIDVTTGVYPGQRGDESNEVAGVAIQARANQSQISNYHFFDNMKRSLRHTGRCLVEIIPKIYDNARVARILKEDGTQKIVKLNQPDTDPDSGKTVLYDLSQGRYDVSVDTGPTYATRRQEAEESMLEFSKVVPQAAPYIADLIAQNADWPGAKEIAERLRLMLPPQLQNNGKQPQLPPQAMALLQQQHAMINGLQAKLNEYAKIIETKQIEIAHKERVEILNAQLEEKKIQADIEKTLAQLGSQSSIALLKEEVGALKHESALLQERLKLSGFYQPINQTPNDFNAQMADGGSFAGAGHVGGGPTGGPQTSPGQPMEGQTP